jgi:hypothetical protein
MRMLIAAGCAAIAMAAPAIGHDSWISRQQLRDPASGEWCCNAIDCRAETVREVAGGYATEGGDVVPFARVIWRSPDGAWHRCRYMSGPREGRTRCLIGPPPGS